MHYIQYIHYTLHDILIAYAANNVRYMQYLRNVWYRHYNHASLPAYPPACLPACLPASLQACIYDTRISVWHQYLGESLLASALVAPAAVHHQHRKHDFLEDHNLKHINSAHSYSEFFVFPFFARVTGKVRL